MVHACSPSTVKELLPPHRLSLSGGLKPWGRSGPDRSLVLILWFLPPDTAEVERPGTEHLDLAGLPQRSPTSDSTHTLPTTPETGKKKATGIKRLFGKYVLALKPSVDP